MTHKEKKLLNVGKCYDTIISRIIREKKENGLSIDKNAEELGLHSVTVRINLQYERVIYKLEVCYYVRAD